MKEFMLSWGFIVISSVMDAYAATVVKMRFNELGKMDLSSPKVFINYILNFLNSPLVIIAVIAFLVAPFLWFIALNRVQLSIGYPVIQALHLLFVLIFSIWFVHEEINTNKIIGVICIGLSLYFFYKA